MVNMPNGWQIRKVEELCYFSNGHGFRPSDWSTHGMPIIRIQNLNGSGEFNYYSGEPEADWLVEHDTLLFAWAGTRGVSFGPTIWRGPRGVLNQHIYRIHPRKEIDKRWLFWLLKVITAQIERNAHGFKSTLVHVRKDDITGQVVGVPPLAEQRKIAELLDTWDDAFVSAERLVAALRERKRSLTQRLVTGKLRNSAFIGRRTQEIELKECLTLISRTEQVQPDQDYKLIGVRWYLEGAHIHSVVRGREVVTRVLSRIQENDVLYNKMWVSKGAFAVARSEHDGAYGTGEYPQFQARDDLDVSFLEYAFHDPKFLHAAKALCRGTTGRIRLDPQDFLKLKVQLPYRDEQVSIASVLRCAQDEIEQMQHYMEKLRAQKKGLMQRLLTAQSRVKADEE